MISLLKKFFRLVRTRPTQLGSALRSFLLFKLNRVLVNLVFGRSPNVHLGRNVRVQRVGSLVAEQPNAHLHLGEDSVLYENAKVEVYGTGILSIGRNCIIGDARIYSKESVTLGDRVVTSWNVFIQDYDPHPIDPGLRAKQMIDMTRNFKPGQSAQKDLIGLAPGEWVGGTRPISIGNDVWIGANVTILKGAKIGSGCVVATGSVVVSGVYPDNSILAGAPAKIIKTIVPLT